MNPQANKSSYVVVVSWLNLILFLIKSPQPHDRQSVDYPVTSHYQSNFQSEILQLILKITFTTSLKMLG